VAGGARLFRYNSPPSTTVALLIQLRAHAGSATSVQMVERGNARQPRELLLEVLVALRLDPALVGLLADLEDPVDDVHPLHNLRERREIHAVQIRVVREAAEQKEQQRSAQPQQLDAERRGSAGRRT